MKIILESQVWDLHLHTNKCPKGSGKFVENYKDDTAGFVDELIKIFDMPKNKDLGMISFTDHNQISYDVYKEYYKRNHRVKLLPGIEIDFLIDKNAIKSKHLIAYFNIEEEELECFANKINKILENTRNDKFLTINELLQELLKLNVEFLISPHAMKQGNRGIDHDWTDEETSKQKASMFTDQFFCFWESSGHSSVTKAEEFLKDFELKNRISIISFSDSDNFETLQNYILEPNQYFQSLPTFKGLALAASDIGRIKKKKNEINEGKHSNYIGFININGKEVELSNQLNTIIGGRGSGKSILLDSIAIERNKTINNQSRKKYIENNMTISLFDGNKEKMGASFSIDYFSQSFVSEIFSSENFGAKLNDKFFEAFQKISDIQTDEIKSENKSKFTENYNINLDQNIENLEGFSSGFPIVNNDGLNLKITKGQKNKESEIKVDSYKDALEKIDKQFSNIIPKSIVNNKNISSLKKLVKYVVAKELFNSNDQIIKTKLSENKLIEKYFDVKDNKSKVNKTKSSHELSIKKNIYRLSEGYIKRANLVNAYLTSNKNFKIKHSKYIPIHGSTENKFIFSKELEVESPLQYFAKQIDKHYNQMKIKNYTLKDKLSMFVKNPNDHLNDSKSLDDLIELLEEFDLYYTEKNNIYYVDKDGKVKDISQLSPGYQTNILMEYIVHKETSIPLLIDQPEDNVDNETIYSDLREWFKSMKSKRQTLLVTHDANLVINADSNNIIIANQVAENEFEYHYGALEYGNIIDRAATILDGGKNAVERRLKKYETGNKK